MMINYRLYEDPFLHRHPLPLLTVLSAAMTLLLLRLLVDDVDVVVVVVGRIVVGRVGRALHPTTRSIYLVSPVLLH